MTSSRLPTVDLPRRAVLRTAATGLGLAAAGALAQPAFAAQPAAAASAEGTPSSTASCATVLELADMVPGVGLVDVRGLLAEGDGGGGLFVWRFTEIGRPNADGVIRIASAVASDGHWMRADYDGTTVRPTWFGTIDETSDNAPVIQKAIDHVVAARGGVVDLGRHTYRCLSTIELDPVLCVLAGSGAVLDASERREVQPAAGGGVTMDDLRAVGTWAGDGGRILGDTGGELVIQKPLKKGERYRVDLLVESLSGDPNGSFLRVSVRGLDGSEPISRRTIGSAGREVYEFDWTRDGPARITLSTNAKVAISAFELAPYGRRETLRVRSRPDGRQYGHTWLQGIRLIGPGTMGRDTGLEGIRFETETPALSSRFAVRDVMVEGFGTAVVMSDRCYLVQFFGCRFVSDIGVHFLGGTEDAGENISFFGCIIGGGRIGILNDGAELNLFGTSVNFTEQFYVGRGTVLASGCHFETERTGRDDQYLFDVGDGRFAIEGGTILVSGRDFARGNEASHIVMTRSRLARFTMSGTFCYNLRSKTGVFAAGPGSVRLTDLAGDAARHVAPIPQRNLATNLFGPASRLDRDPMGLLVKLVDDGTDSPPGLGTIRRSSAEGTEPETGFLEVTKAGAVDAPLSVWMLAPAARGMRIGWTVEAKLERAGGAQAVDLSADLLFVQLLGDGSGQIGGSVEAKRPIALAAGDLADWHDVAGTTLETREDDWSDGTAPAFATHIALRFDMSPLGPGDRLLLRAPYAGAV